MTDIKTNKVKRIGFIILTLVFLVCIGVVIWWTLVQFLAPNKVIYDTHNVDSIKLVDGTDKKNIIEVRYYSNDNGSGLEMMDIKFNEFADETKQMFYSQGIQFVANTSTDTLKWNTNLKKYSHPNLFGTTIWWASYDSLENGSIHTYASMDDYESTLNDAQALGGSDDFLIELGDDMYLMEFEGKNTSVEEAYSIAESESPVSKIKIKSYNDVYLASKLIYEQIQGLDNGTSRAIAFNLNDLIQFKYYNGNGTFISEEERETSKIDRRVNDYYVVKVEVFEDGARQASDSLFNNIKGSSNFILDDDYVEDGYFVGRSTLAITEANFDRVIVSDNKVALKLKQDFVEKTKSYKDNIELSISIDLNALSNEGYEFLGFTKDSGLQNYKIKKCVTTQSIDGEILETEVVV